MMAALVICVSVGLAGAMTIAWLVQRRIGNAGWVDAMWSFALGASGVVYALCPLRGQIPTARQWLVALLVAAWSLRLGLHIAGRTAHGAEDARYAQFRRDWGTEFQHRMFWFLQI
jgi:steroid 5-alpha reductase family enzyme